MHLIYGAANGSTPQAARMYGEHFSLWRFSNPKILVSLHRQLYETGYFLDSRSDTGHIRTTRSAGVVEAILKTVADQPTAST